MYFLSGHGGQRGETDQAFRMETILHFIPSYYLLHYTKLSLTISFLFMLKLIFNFTHTEKKLPVDFNFNEVNFILLLMLLKLKSIGLIKGDLDMNTK